MADCDAVAYMASGDTRPDEAIGDIVKCLRAGRHVVTPSLYSLYDPRSAPPEWIERLTAAAEEGGATLLVSGVDPGWANDALAVMAAGLCTRIHTIYCQEIFDYSIYDQPYAVKVSCGFGGPMDEVPMMLLRLPLEASVENVMGHFEKGTQGAFWLKFIGWSGGKKRIVVDHITRIDPARLLGAIEWLATQKAGNYDGLDVPLHTQLPDEVEADALGRLTSLWTVIRLRTGALPRTPLVLRGNP